MRILYLVADSLRADVLPPYGGTTDARNLADLASEGTRFNACMASGGWTVPSVASLVTGRYPHRVGSVLWRHGLPADIPNLFAAFSHGKHEVLSFPFSTRWMFAGVAAAGVAGSSQDVAATCAAIESTANDALIYVHYWWTHAPYVSEKLPADKWKAAVERLLAEMDARPDARAAAFGRYEKSILHFDREILPRLIDAVTRGGREALVVLTADHGEDFGPAQRGEPRFSSLFDLHGRHLTDATCRVPLVFWGPGVPARTDALGGIARGVDLPVTLVSLAGLDPLADVDGVDLSAAIRSGGPAPANAAFTVSPHNTFEETVVPAEADALWRLWSLRDETKRLSWDRACDRRRTFAVRADGRETETDPADAPPEGWKRIADEAKRAVPAPDDGEDERIADELRGLGYFA